MILSSPDAFIDAGSGVTHPAGLESIHLVVECLPGAEVDHVAEDLNPPVLSRLGTAGAAKPERCIIIVPEKVVGLTLPPAGRLSCLISVEEMDRTVPAVIVEPVRAANAAALLILNPMALDIRVNGVAAPPLDILVEGDQLDWGAGCLLHVAVYNRPRVGKVRPEMALRECAVCSLPIGEATAYLCPCGAVCHHQGEETPPEVRLECGKLSDQCPACGRKKVFTAGFQRFPELVDEQASL